MVDLAWKTLLYDPVRFVMTVAGVAFADVLVLVQVGLFFGLLDNASVTIDHIDADLWVTSRNTPNIDFPHGFSESIVQRVRSVPGVERADNLIINYMDVALPSGAKETALVYALEDFSKWRIPWQVTEGDVRDLRRGRYVIFDESAERRFGKFSVGEYREVMEQRLKIIGRSREALSFTTSPVGFIDYRLAQELVSPQLDGQTTYVLVKCAPGANVLAVRDEIRRRAPWNDVHTRAEWKVVSRGYWIDNTGLGINLYLTVFLGCLVGVVIVAQTLYAQTLEHLREFGTVKAIGGSNLDIYAILARQASIAAIVGFLLGCAGPFVMDPVVRSMGLKLIVPAWFFGVTFLGTLGLCLAASMVSFRKVAAIDPALVFRG